MFLDLAQARVPVPSCAGPHGLSGVSPTAQTQACLRGHSLACPWGAWPLCRLEGPCRGPGAPGAGRAAGALGEAEPHTGCRGGQEVVPASGRQAPGEGCGPSAAVQALSRGERSASVIWGCVHTQGVNVGSPFSRRVAASRCSGLSTWGVHPQHRAGSVWWGLWSVCSVRGGDRW